MQIMLKASTKLYKQIKRHKSNVIIAIITSYVGEISIERSKTAQNIHIHYWCKEFLIARADSIDCAALAKSRLDSKIEYNVILSWAATASSAVAAVFASSIRTLIWSQEC